MIHKPPPHNRDDNRDPNIKALKRKGFINHGSTLIGNVGMSKLYACREQFSHCERAYATALDPAPTVRAASEAASE